MVGRKEFLFREYILNYTHRNREFLHTYVSVGLILNRKVGKRVKSYVEISDRLLAVTFNSIEYITERYENVYMPTLNHDDEEVEKVYDEVANLEIFYLSRRL